MKIYNLILAFTLYIVCLTYGSASPNPDSLNVSSRVVIKATFLPFLGEAYIRGRATLTTTELYFSAFPCREDVVHFMTPCNNHLVKSVVVKYSDIERISRRNYLFLIPDRLYIKMALLHGS